MADTPASPPAPRVLKSVLSPAPQMLGRLILRALTTGGFVLLSWFFASALSTPASAAPADEQPLPSVTSSTAGSESGNGLVNTVGAVTKTATDTADSVESTAKSARGSGDSESSAKSSATSGLTSTVTKTVDTTVGTVSNTVDTTAGTVNNTVRTVTKTVDATVSTVNSTVKSVTSTAATIGETAVGAVRGTEDGTLEPSTGTASTSDATSPDSAGTGTTASERSETKAASGKSENSAQRGAVDTVTAAVTLVAVAPETFGDYAASSAPAPDAPHTPLTPPAAPSGPAGTGFAHLQASQDNGGHKAQSATLNSATTATQLRLLGTSQCRPVFGAGREAALPCTTPD